MQTRCHFTWLSAPGLGALAVLYLRGEGVAAFLLARGWRESEKPRHVWLRNALGLALDEIMVAREDGGFTITCHGGPAVRAAFETELRAAGFDECGAGELPLFGAGTRYKREILKLLTQAQCDKGVEYCLWTLEHGEAALGRALQGDDDLTDLLKRSENTRFLFEPLRVHLWGPVNAGKSSLLNALCGERLAAVGEEPGLTRDVIEGRFEHNGLTIRVFDTPGEIVSGSAMERRAFEQGREQRGDCVLHLVPPGGALPSDKSALVVFSRADEGPARRPNSDSPFPISVSVYDGASLLRLKDALVELQRPRVSPQTQDAFALSAELRHDLQASVDGKMRRDELRRKWL